jgi:sulfatase maturation enzyme AslB (radical SAM superfamily)
MAVYKFFLSFGIETMIDKENVDWLAKLVSGFNISMEGSSADIHDKIRGKGSFARTMAALGLLVEYNVPLAVRMT